jgi:acyl carrier protein
MRSGPGNAVFDKVAMAVEQTVDVEASSLSPAHRLADDLRLGKFGRIRLALYLEETFDVELDDDDVARFRTVGDIVRHMNRWTVENGRAGPTRP